jgi:predicted MFS family arabinose efflux permease
VTAPERTGQRTALALLVVAYTLNFVDRQVIGILAGPIKAELALSDTQLGVMGGVAFALFYSVLGIPLGLLSDRTSRSGVISGAIALWSGFTALCGLATGFWSLFVCRVGVGVGEAGGVAPSFALIADATPKERRARAIAIFALGSPIGSALGIFLGGWLATTVDWRWAFFALGAAGLIFVPIFRLGVKEPPRAAARATGATDTSGASGASGASGGPLRDAWRAIARNPSFWLLSLAAASTSLVGYGLLFWLPSFFTRSFELDLLTTSRLFGAIVLLGGIGGLWVGGSRTDRHAAKSRRAYALVPALALSLAVPLYAVGVLSSSLKLTFICFLAGHALGLMWYGPVVAAVQQLVPPDARGLASGIFLFVLNLLGIGGGALFFGAVSDAFAVRFGTESLRYAILAGLGFYLVAVGLFLAASKRIEQDFFSHA